MALKAGLHATLAPAILALAVMLHIGVSGAAEVPEVPEVPKVPEAAPNLPLFSFSGFGTAGFVHSSERHGDFNSQSTKPRGAGVKHAWSADVDSRIAAQVVARPASRLSAVVQVVAEQNYDNTYRPHVEWANVKFEFTPDLSVRAGRSVIPTFLVSDSRKVGYSYAWVRPPSEVYRLLPITNIDGLDISYRFQAGGVANTLQANIGQADIRIADEGGKAEARDVWGLAYGVDSGPWSARISYQKASLSLSGVAPLFDAFRQFGPEGIALAHRYDIDDTPYSLLGLGASYDPGDWFVVAEWGRLHGESFGGKQTAWYVSGGYRYGSVTPYVVYAKASADHLTDPGLTVALLPPALAGTASGLNAALNELLSRKPVQDTVSIGARWDLMRNTDVKLQFDHMRIGAGSRGLLTNVQPGYQPGKVNVISVTMDFVF